MRVFQLVVAGKYPKFELRKIMMTFSKPKRPVLFLKMNKAKESPYSERWKLKTAGRFLPNAHGKSNGPSIVSISTFYILVICSRNYHDIVSSIRESSNSVYSVGLRQP